jgi:hypothetical protein
VLLDDVSEMPLALQSKLLTFLETRSFRRLAGSRILKSEAAVIACSRRDLRELAESKRFRSDLHIRLGMFSLAVPPLRERREDVLELARQEMARLNGRYGADKELDPEALRAILGHPFPGNVRELLDCLHQAVLLSDRPQIGEFVARILESSRPGQPVGGPAATLSEDRLSENLNESERLSLMKAIATCRNTREMAERLGISQAGVSRKLKKHGLPLPKYRSTLLSPAPGTPDTMSATPVPRPAMPVTEERMPVPEEGAPVPKPTTPVHVAETPVPKPTTPVHVAETPVPKPTTPVHVAETPVPKPMTPVPEGRMPVPRHADEGGDAAGQPKD